MGRLPVFLEEGDIYQLFKTPCFWSREVVEFLSHSYLSIQILKSIYLFSSMLIVNFPF